MDGSFHPLILAAGNQDPVDFGVGPRGSSSQRVWNKDKQQKVTSSSTVHLTYSEDTSGDTARLVRKQHRRGSAEWNVFKVPMSMHGLKLVFT